MTAHGPTGPAAALELVPVDVVRVARGWDGQHLDLWSAARRLAVAPAGGFTPALRGDAGRFAGGWARGVGDLAAEAAAHAAALRDTVADLLATDHRVSLRVLALRGLLRDAG